MLITRSIYYALCRFKNWEAWAWRPPDAAASILGVPLGQAVPDELLKRVTWMVDEPLRRPSGKTKAARFLQNPELHRMWVQHQFCALALGTPTRYSSEPRWPTATGPVRSNTRRLTHSPNRPS